MKLLGFLVALVACVDGNTDIGVAAVAACGERPLTPGIVAEFADGRASMTVETYEAITDYMDASAAWTFCVENL